MNRRRFLALGVLSAAALSAAGGAALWWRASTATPPKALDPRQREVLRAFARGVLDGSLPPRADVATDMLDRHLERVESAVAAFPPHVRRELHQLLAVLANPVGRRALAGLGAPWPEATVADLQAAFDGMRRSSLALRQQAFGGLRDLTNAAFFAEPGTWALLGYPGPRPL